MAVRATMNSLISRVRVMINDTLPAGSGQIFSDQNIQDIMDETRQDTNYLLLTPYPTYTGSSMLFLDYYADPDNWEDNVLLYQYRTTLVTPSSSENIIGHWHFAATTLPPVYAQGSYYDLYRVAADLLERWAARWTLAYAMSVDGQSLQRSQALTMLLDLAHTYRLKQIPTIISMRRSDLSGDTSNGVNLDPRPIDFYSSGDGR